MNRLEADVKLDFDYVLVQLAGYSDWYYSQAK